MLRSCYSADVRFGSDPSQVSKIQWFWCEPGARPLGFPTTFVSRNWIKDQIWPDVGEIQGAPRPWRDGSFPVDVPGTHPPCGARGVWLSGYPGTVPPVYFRNDFGLLLCCDPTTTGTRLTVGLMAGTLTYIPPAAGGLSLGGRGDQFGYLPSMGAGGLALGGAGDTTGFLVAKGGLSVGGPGDLAGYLPAAGGLSMGGPGDVNGYPPAAGGLSMGGPGDRTGQVAAAGGLSVGGPGDLAGYLPAAGGLSMGGAVDSVTPLNFPKFYTAVCAAGDPGSVQAELPGGVALVYYVTLGAWQLAGPDMTITLKNMGSFWTIDYVATGTLAYANYQGAFSGSGMAGFAITSSNLYPFGEYSSLQKVPTPSSVFVSSANFSAVCELPDGVGLSMGGKGDLTGQKPAVGGLSIGGVGDVVTPLSPTCTQGLAQSPNSGSATGLSITVTWASPTTAGNLLAIAIYTEQHLAGVAPNPPAGWIKLAGGPSGSAARHVAIYFLPSAPSTSSVVFSATLNVTNCDWVTFEFSPGSLAGIADQANYASGNSLNPTLSTGSTAGACEIALSAIGNVSLGTYSSPSPGWTTITIGSMIAAYKILTAVGVETFGCTISIITTWDEAIGTIQ